MKFVKTNLLICNWPSSLRKSYVFFVMIIVRLFIMYSTNIICFLLAGYTLLCMSTFPVDTFPNSGVTYSTSSKSPSTDELVAVVASAPQRDNRAREFRCRKARTTIKQTPPTPPCPDLEATAVRVLCELIWLWKRKNMLQFKIQSVTMRANWERKTWELADCCKTRWRAQTKCKMPFSRLCQCRRSALGCINGDVDYLQFIWPCQKAFIMLRCFV